MSDKLPEQPQNEEVDLGQLFNAIGRLFEKLFAFIGKVFRGLFSAIIFALKPLVNNIKLVAIVLMIGVVIGYISEKFQSPVYSSDMLVKPYFDSKYQLANNVDYFNALINSRNLNALSNIFEIDTVKASELLGFKIEIGPETQNDLLIKYDEYIKSIDSTLAKDVTYDVFIENRDVLAGTIFSIKAKASSNDIFTSLEKGFVKTFENEYSKKLKRISDSTRLIQKVSYQKELGRIDSLQRIYLQILKTESEDKNLSMGGSGFFPLTKEKSVTREYDLFQEEQKIRNSIRQLDEKLIEESEYYDILSGFEDVGSKEYSVYKKHTVIFPLIALALTILTFIIFKVFNFIKDYE